MLTGTGAYPALCLLYVLAGKVGLQFAFVHASASPLWPPTGIALAALLLGGSRLWPAIFLGAFLVNVTTAGSIATSLGIAAGNTLEALAGAWLVRRWANGVDAFTSPRSIFVFALTAGLGATAISATIGVTTLAAFGYAPWPSFGTIWVTWWLGDAAGALVLAPFLIVWVNGPRWEDVRIRWAEAVFALLLVAAVASLVFGGRLDGVAHNPPIAYLSLPPLVWAAYRFGPRGGATALLVLTVIAIVGTLHGHGPFAGGDANRSLLLLQGFVVTLAGTVLPLAALSEELARRAASSAENARLYRESEGQRRTADAFSQTSQALLESLAVREVTERIVTAVRELLGGTIAIVFERDPTTGTHTAVAASGADASAFVGHSIPAEVGAIGLAAREQRPIVTPDVTADPRITLTTEVRTRTEASPMRAVVAVPLVAQGTVIGSFLVGDREGRIFTPEETVVAEAFAHHAALAIRNARLYAEAERARHAAEATSARSAFVADASIVIASTLDDAAVLRRVAELAVPRTADWCAVFLRDGDSPIQCVTFHHRDPELSESGRAYIVAQPIDADAPYGVARVIRSGEAELTPVVTDAMIRAVARDDAGVRMRLALGHRSIMAVPLRIDETVRGAMVFGRGTPNAYDAADLALAEDLARRVALAMQNARLYRVAREARERAERAGWQAAFLAETSRLLASSLDYDATLDMMIRHAVPVLADWVVAHLARRDGTVRRIGPAYADPALAPLAEEIGRAASHARVPVEGRDPAADVLRTGRSLLVPDFSREWIERATPDVRAREYAARLNPTSMIVVPLLARGRTLGALTFVSLRPERRYGAADLPFVEEIGRRVGLAIDNARLYRHTEEARAQAEAANRAKDEFLAILSHELRTPLNSIAGWMHMLEQRAIEGAQADRALRAVGRNVTVLRQLIEDLLDVSRIVAGKLTLERAPCDFITVVEQSVDSFGREAEMKQVTLKTELDRGLVVEGDALRLRQIVSNLLSNALKFTPAGGHVMVSLHRSDGWAVLTVTDTGPGIASEVLPHIFERFRQGDSSTTRHYGGLGLGLAIVEHLVELHGGRVRAENRPASGGAVFTIELPAA